MALAEHAKLAVDLTLNDHMSGPAGKAKGSIDKLGTSADKASTHSQRLGKIGGGVMKAGLLGVGAAAAIAVTGITAGVFAIKRWADEGADAAKQQLLLDRQIEKSGKVSKAQAKAINDQAGALLNLTGVDDDAIKGADAMLLRFGATGDQVTKLTPLILDLSKAQGISLEAATKAVGKALNGNAGALGKYGIVVDKAKLKTDAFGTTQDALTKKVGGTAAAMGKTLPGQLDIMRERMANVREEAGQRLAPSLLRLVTVVASKGIPVFEKLVERVLPLMEKGINLVTDALDKAGGPGGSSFFTKLGDIPFDSIAGGMKITAQATKTLVDAFLALPPDVQKIAVAALAANKLSGGLVTSGIGSLLKLGLGGLKTITAGSVTVVGAKVGGAGVGGGAAGAAGAATSTAGKVGSFLGKVAIVGEVIGLVAAVEGVRESIGAGNSALASQVHDQTTAFIASKPNNAALQSSLAGIDKGIADIQSNPLNVLVQGDALDQLKAMRADVANQLANNKVPTLGEHANDRTVAAVNKANATIGRGIIEGHRDTDKLDGSVRRTPTEIAAAKRATVAATNAASASARANAARINAGIHSSSAANVGANHHLAAVTSNGLAHLGAEVNHTTSATKAASAAARANAALIRAGIHSTGAATVSATHALRANTTRGLAHLSGEVNRLPPRLARAIPKPKAPIVRLTVNQRISLKAVVSARSQHDVLVTASRYGAVYGSGNAQ
jgi:hypothetical protein